MSKIFKSSRIVLDDKAFVLSSTQEQKELNHKVEELAVAEHIDAEATANQLIEEARREANKILEEADRHYDEKMAAAQASSDAIISDAYDQAKGIMEQAKADGYQDGYNRGIEDSQEIAKQIVDEALSIKSEWNEIRKKVYKEAESEMITLVIEAIEKVFDYKVETDQSIIETLIKQGIERISKSHAITIRVSNEDYNHALSVRPMLLATSDKIEEMELKRDPSLPSGSCMIDTDSGSIDSSLSTQLDQIRKIFEDLLKGD